MSGHNEACEDSNILCDKLYECLLKKIINLKRKETKEPCGLYQEGRKRFAYIYHRKYIRRIEVWCLGDPEELQRKTTLKIKIRRIPTTGGFGKFQASFFVNHQSEIKSACELLYQESYRLS